MCLRRHCGLVGCYKNNLNSFWLDLSTTTVHWQTNALKDVYKGNEAKDAWIMWMSTCCSYWNTGCFKLLPSIFVVLQSYRTYIPNISFPEMLLLINVSFMIKCCILTDFLSAINIAMTIMFFLSLTFSYPCKTKPQRQTNEAKAGVSDLF